MLSIIILSSDGYSDCWEPLFTLLKKNFPNIDDCEILLSTNEKEYVHPELKIRSLKNGIETPWSKRLQMSLEQSSHDIVMIMVEDFFLLSKMSQEHFKIYLDLIKTDKKIDHIRLLYNQDKVAPISTDNPFIDRIPSFTNHRFLFLPGLWKKEVINKYIVDFESPHIAEKMGNYRSWILRDHFYCVSNDFIGKHGKLFDCATSGAIIKGKWGKWLPERLEENNIQIDYSKRGFKTNESQKSGKKNVQIGLLQNPKSTFKSLAATLNLIFKR